MNHIKVLFFATLRDRSGEKAIEMDISAETTVQGLKDLLVETYPNLKATMDTTVVSVNREFAFDESLIPADAEVALFPPVSGG